MKNLKKMNSYLVKMGKKFKQLIVKLSVLSLGLKLAKIHIVLTVLQLLNLSHLTNLKITSGARIKVSMLSRKLCGSLLLFFLGTLNFYLLDLFIFQYCLCYFMGFISLICGISNKMNYKKKKRENK